jgi:hypothetical protein
MSASRRSILYFRAQAPLQTPDGQITRDAAQRLNALINRTGGESGKALGPLPSYTVAELLAGDPDPAAYAQCLVYVSNGTSNKRLAISDGSDWRFPDGSIVS